MFPQKISLSVIFAHRRSVTIDGVELMIIIIATFAQALSGNAPAVHILGVLIVWRFIVSRISLSTEVENMR